MTNSSKITSVLAAVLLFLVFLQPFLSARNFGPAGDEISHLPAGYSYWRTGEITLNPQHPPLIKLLAALPLLFLNPEFSAEDIEMGEWRFGSKFLFQNDADQLLFWGRLPMILISVLLAFFVFKWAKEMFGERAGLLALFLYTFMPGITAQAQFVATDLGVGAFIFIALYWFWRFLRSASRKHLIYTGIFSGLALSAKFSGLILIPLILVLFFLWLYSQKLSLSAKLSRGARAVIAILVLAFLVTYVVYLFPGDPGYYSRGFKALYADRNPFFLFYLNGNYDQGGWWYYFLWAFLIKTPIAFLVLLVLAVIFHRKLNLKPLDLGFIVIPAAAIFVLTSWQAFNIGVRYILPAYPFLILAASGFGAIIDRGVPFKKFFLILTALLLIWQTWAAVRIYPDYLAYFNELVGGPANGYHYLDDSNLSWGQELKRLARYQKEYPEAKVIYPWQYTSTDYYGIKNNLSPLKKNWWSEPSGIYVADVNFLIRAKILSRLKNDSTLDWLNLYQPIEKIGYSYFVYKFK